MKGIIYITDAESGIGKILFDNGTESKIMSFPASYDSGDAVEISYLNSNPRNKVIQLEATSPILHYGSLLVPKAGDQPRPMLIANYPLPLGLIRYDIKQIGFPIIHKHRLVCFRVRKNIRGELFAFDVQQVNTNEQHKCNPPSYGVLSTSSLPMEDAYISAIGSRQDPSIFTGVIYSIVVRDESSSDAHTFGFISSKQAGEVFFNAKAYRSVYGKEPLQGSSVFFTALPAAKGKRVERFYASNQIDPSNRCITIKAGGREFKVLVSKYMDFAGKDPVIGDIVTGFIDNDRYILGNPDEDHDARYVLSPAFDDNSAIVQQGQICQTDTGKRTGIVMLHDRKSLAFSFDDFSRCIGGFPRPPKNVYVIADKSKRKVSQFCTFNALVCRQSQFRNFTEPLPDTICKAFKAADSQNIEVFKANLENLSEAIACYKSPDLSLTLKLPAIETLICHKFSDRSVNLGKLKAERIQILQDLIAQSLRVGHFDRAIEYELRLQKLRYEPKELSRLSGIPRWFDPVSAELKDINPLPYPSPWNLCSADAGFSPSHVPAQPAWGLLMQQPHPELKEIPERAWSIDLSAIPRSEARTEASTYYHIKIER